jgi:hypothetical protein
MKAITNRWKMLVTLLFAGLTLFFVVGRVAAGHSSSTAREGTVAVPAAEPQPVQEPPASNEIRDSPQLG